MGTKLVWPSRQYLHEAAPRVADRFLPCHATADSGLVAHVISDDVISTTHTAEDINVPVACCLHFSLVLPTADPTSVERTRRFESPRDGTVKYRSIGKSLIAEPLFWETQQVLIDFRP